MEIKYCLNDLVRVHAPIASNSYEFYVKSYRMVGDAILYYGKTATGAAVNAVHPRYCKLVRKDPVHMQLPYYPHEGRPVTPHVPKESLLDDVNLYSLSKEDLGLSDVDNLTVEEISKKFDVMITVLGDDEYRLYRDSDEYLVFRGKEDLVKFLELQEKYLEAVNNHLGDV